MKRYEGVEGLYFYADDVYDLLKHILGGLNDPDASLWAIKGLIEEFLINEGAMKP